MSSESTPLLIKEWKLKEEAFGLLHLAAPLIATFSLEFLPMLLSVAIVGHIDSSHVQEYVSAVALSTMFTTVTGISIGHGLISAMDTLCSQAIGAQKPYLLGLHLRTGLLIVGSVYVVMFAINWNAGSLLEALGQDANVALISGNYSKITIFGLPGLFLYELLKRSLQADGVVAPMVYIAIISNVIYIGLAYILCYYTTLSLYGAGLARLISNLSLPLMAFIYLTISGKHNPWKFHETTWGDAWAHGPTFLKLGVAGMTMMLMEWWAFELMAFVAGMLANPTVSISTHAIVANVSTALYNLFLGFSVATSIRVGQLVGADNYTDARRMSFLGLGLTFIVGLLVGTSCFIFFTDLHVALVLYAFHMYIPSLFINDNATIEQAQHTLVVLALFEMMDAVNCTAKGILRAIGKQDIGVYVSLVAYYIIGIPLAVFFGVVHNFNVPGLWIGLAAGVSTSAIFFVGLISRTKSWATVINHSALHPSKDIASP
ncbi:Multidrug/Oligosaccharidyl-lipid/Polysaccharide (MOP) Flippase Superfamily [Thraustotheca clavata]|uniref:Multidrug/Oligosaccharidyl-lipid/Polysaccharide (MOP) Flippase Superfamily n=1 Tax=Thraustotheca clavata TaxID=74557 RepID=A0A1W0A7R1_9STRA|nr:Multidrug/Oligosaccharidyl-lipid/Polysaccharide (MOP) Flippase Superfamily [Thraustotheca clavata]